METFFKNQNTNCDKKDISFKNVVLKTSLVLLFCTYSDPFCIAEYPQPIQNTTYIEPEVRPEGFINSEYPQPSEPIQNVQPSNSSTDDNDEVEAEDVIIHATPGASDLTESSSTYEPSISSKIKSGVINYNFYYYSANKSGGRWMSRLAKFYDGRTDEDIKQKLTANIAVSPYPSIEAIKGLRRGITPSAMVDSKGDLYTLSLCGFGKSGPEFQLKRYWCSEKKVNTKSVKFYPWKLAYEGSSLKLPVEPKLVSDSDKKLFNWSFHNALSLCLFKETEDFDTYARIFCPIPNQKYIDGVSDVEGGFFLKFEKKSLDSDSKPTKSRMYSSSNEKRFAMNRMTSRRYGNNTYAFQNCWGNYQGIIAEFPGNESWYIWLFFLALSEGGKCNTCQAYYKKVWSAVFGDNESGKIILASENNKDTTDKSDSDVRRYICPRFIRVGSYIYYAILRGGYWMSFGRMDINGNMKFLGSHISDCFLETTQNWFSDSAYNFDFCILNKDGTPCTKASPDDTNEDTRKILCVFSLGGGGDHTGMISNLNWEKTYINWGVTCAAGIISSVLLPANGGSIDTTYGAWAQNTIYVTGLQRGNGPVSITNTEKSDEYRLYLNSHKIVPYTSPSGKHYMIYAYCYPGKKEHLYLGYAQYFIDSKYRVTLLSQTEFRDTSGNSFGNFTHCSRIISMDLKNGHLWITFVKDTGWDATEQEKDVKKKAGCYYYFHILASDLIQE